MSKALPGFFFPPGITVLVSLYNSTVVSYINREVAIHSLFPIGRERAPVSAGLQAADFTAGGPHTRKDELFCQSSVLPLPDSSQGVVTQPGGHKKHVPPMGLSPCRPVCHQVECHTPNLCVNGRPLSFMAGPKYEHISSSSVLHLDSDQAVLVQRTASPCDSILACSTLVPVPPGTVHRPPLAASYHRYPLQTTTVGQAPPGPRQVAALHIQAVTRSFIEFGLSIMQI